MEEPEAIVSLHEEMATVEKRTIETGKINVLITPVSETRTIDLPLEDTRMEVEHVEIGRFVTERPRVRTDGDTVVIPVLEERPVVTLQLFLREELRVRAVTTRHMAQQTVNLRRDEVTVNRNDIEKGTPSMSDDQAQPEGLRHTPASGHTIASMFATRSAAERARDALVEHGINAADVSLIDQTASGSGAAAGAVAYEGGIWESLKRMFMGEDEAEGYYEGIHRGQTLLSVNAQTEEQADRAASVIEEYDPIDLDAQEASWRDQGWRGRPGPTGGMASGAARPAGAMGQPVAGMDVTGKPSRTEASGYSTAQGRAAPETTSIPLAEEKLAIGRRDVQRGSVRIRSYVVQTPVEQDVQLREERVRVERVPADASFRASADDAFQERTVEMTETSQEPVIQKTVHSAGEVRVQKDVTERTEHVSDTVRRTEVEINDDRTKAAGSAKTGSAAAGPTGTGQGGTTRPGTDRR
jgi:uncharacterized protein (TIGR02271 family)